MPEEETTSLVVWIGLSVIAILSFYSQAAVTEERFVPALNVIANKFNIPDDIAGATLMAAGASSPELFSSIVALFITHSALGLGTIVGSEIFNQLVICAGAIFATKGDCLELDRAVVTREVFFYALSIGLLLFTLHDIEPVDDDTYAHIFISFSDACILCCGYLLYVLVCANFEAVVRFFTCSKKDESVASSGRITQFDNLDGIPFLKVGVSGNEESSIPQRVFQITKGGEQSKKHLLDESTQLLPGTSNVSSLYSKESQPSSSLRRSSSVRRSQLEKSLQYTLGSFSDGGSLRMFRFFMQDEKPSDQHELYDIEINAFEERLSCFLWQRSYFYTKSKFATKGWNLRWFTFTPTRASSVPDRVHFLEHRISYPHFDEIEVDEKRLIIRVINPDKKKRHYYFMAPSQQILNAVVEKLELIIATTTGETEEGNTDANDDGDDPESHGSLLDFPHGGSNIDVISHMIVFPLKALMHFTIPDVRVLDRNGAPTSTLTTAYLSSFMCLVWLIVGSYAMVASLEALADLLNIPDAVIGVTVSAAGTSLPNYVASKVAAEKGFGNMAVSNAFGSNTFNILVALGFPWLLYTSIGTNFKPYHGLRNEGILESVLILSAVLAIFIVNLLMSGFKLYKWHGYLYIFLYVAYLAFAIAQVYL